MRGWKVVGLAVFGLAVAGLAGCQSPGLINPLAGLPADQGSGAAVSAPDGSGTVQWRTNASPAGKLNGEGGGGEAPAGQTIIQTAAKEADAPAADGSAKRAEGRSGSKDDRTAPGYRPDRFLPSPITGFTTPVIPEPTAVCPLALPRALALAGVASPQIALAEQAVQSSLALQLRAQALLLPSLTVGTNYDWHTGVLQNSFGAIRPVTRDALYFGAGARTVAAESVMFPGVRIFAQLAEAYFEPQIASRVVTARQFDALAVRNNILLDVAVRYLELLRAEGELAVIRQSQADYAEVARLTANYAKTGAGSESNAIRARTDALLIEDDERAAQERVAVAAAELARFLNVDPSVRLQTGDTPVKVVQFVDPAQPLCDLEQIATVNRPEMSARAADIGAAAARLNEERYRPLFPTLSVGYSYGDFGGGSTISRPLLGRFAQRSDLDVFAFWTLQNLGLGNMALVRQQRARLTEAELVQIRVLNQIREEVADAYNTSNARLTDVEVARREVQSGVDAFNHDFARVRSGLGLPIELLTSTRALYDARRRLMATIIDYDVAQFQLFVALGQPPTLVADKK